MWESLQKVQEFTNFFFLKGIPLFRKSKGIQTFASTCSALVFQLVKSLLSRKKISYLKNPDDVILNIVGQGENCCYLIFFFNKCFNFNKGIYNFSIDDFFVICFSNRVNT